MTITTRLCGFAVLALILQTLWRWRTLTANGSLAFIREEFAVVAERSVDPSTSRRHFKVLLQACTPVPMEWIEGHSSVSVESNCSNPSELLEATKTVVGSTRDHTDLVCILSAGYSDIIERCLYEALAYPERSTALVIPTAHILPSFDLKPNVKLIPRQLESPIIQQENHDSFVHDVVLYLPCDEPAELISITKAIPAYTRKLEILQQECGSSALLRHNGSDVADIESVLSKLLPLTNITTINCVSVKDWLRPMLEARHLICLPSLACLASGLMSTGNVTFILLNNADGGILSGSRLQPNVQIVTEPISCLHLQGRVGSWGYNTSFFKAHKYNEDLQWIEPNRQFKGSRYRSSNYFWSDDYCPVSPMTKATFCSAMEKLGFRRFIFLGDSLQYMAIRSFLHQVGILGHAVTLGSHLKDPICRATQVVQCSQTFAIRIVLHRYNHAWPNYATNYSLGAYQLRRAAIKYVRAPNENRSSKMFEYFQGPHMMFPDERGFLPWVYDYQNSTEKTLLLVNVGAHFHHVDFFRQSISHFENYLRAHPRPDDWIVLQTLYPGHDNCSQEEEPYSSFSEYLAKGWTTKYDWHLFTEYNRILEELAFKARSRDWDGAKVDLHDVQWMTALRKDGHPSAEDCLHYLLPGPPDFWIHTLYSMIQERANGVSLIFPST